MFLTIALGGLAALSFVLLAWQWWVGARFPLHQTIGSAPALVPGITLLKPLKGCDAATEGCLRSWFEQEYSGQIEILFGVASAQDPVIPVIEDLRAQFPGIPSRLMICSPLAGTNAKVAKLIELEKVAAHELIVISDADVYAPSALLNEIAGLMGDASAGLANCFYRLPPPVTAAMGWEVIAINVDFWSQVLQANSLKPMDFALGAVMATRRTQLQEIGGFSALRDCLADDYQLGRRIARAGHRIVLASTVVECRSHPLTWPEVWKHQVRWARTIRVCQPLPYFFSILSNATLWPLLWLCLRPSLVAGVVVSGMLLFRILTARDLHRRLTGFALPALRLPLVLVKDVLQLFIWGAAFCGNSIEWRGERMRLKRDGTLEAKGNRNQVLRE